MPSRIVTFFHNSRKVEQHSAVGTAFDKTKDHAHDLLAGNSNLGRKYGARSESVVIRVSAIAGGATKLTFRMCLDADGDHTVVPDTEAALVTGLTTAASGCVAFSIKLPVFQVLSGETGTVYLFFKTDAGTVQVEESTVTWSET